MRRLLMCSGLLAILGMFSPCNRAQLPPTVGRPAARYYIHGTVRRDDDSSPVERVKVELRTIGEQIVASTITQGNGDFDFPGLGNGVYCIIVEEKGYERVREEIQIFNASRASVPIFLRQAGGPRPETSDAVVSARELSLPSKARDAMRKGMERLYKKGDPKGSLAYFQRALRVLPTYYEALTQMGVAYMQMGQNEQAEQCLRKSITLSAGRFPDAFFILAALFSNTSRFAEAEPLARQGLQLDANSWRGYYELARAELGENRVEDAARNAGEALNRERDFPELYLVLANIHIRQHNPPALLQDLDAFLRLEPNGPQSEQAREVREKVRRALAARQGPPPEPKKP